MSERRSPFGGIAEPTPSSYGTAATIGVALWRASIFVAPILSIVAAIRAYDLAQEVASSYDWMLDPILIFFTLGLILLFYAVMSVLATFAALFLMALSILGIVLSIPLALALDASLKRTLLGEQRRMPVALLLVGIGGVLAMPLAAAAYPLLGYLALLPLASYVLLLFGREDLRSQRSQRVPVTVAACPACGATPAAGTRFCGACGAPLEASVKPAEA